MADQRMSTRQARWAVGDWVLVVAPYGAILLSPEVPGTLDEDLWEQIHTDGVSLASVLDTLVMGAGGRLARIPDFGLVILGRDRIHLALRGGVVAEVDGARIDAEGVVTWYECRVASAESLALYAPGAADDSASARLHPVRDAVLPASAVHLNVGPAAAESALPSASADSAEEPVLTVVEEDAEAAAAAAAMAAMVAAAAQIEEAARQAEEAEEAARAAEAEDVEEAEEAEEAANAEEAAQVAQAVAEVEAAEALAAVAAAEQSEAAEQAGPVGGSARSAESADDAAGGPSAPSADAAPAGPAGPSALSAADAAPAGPAGPAPAVPAGPPAPVVSPVSASSVPSADDDVFSVPSASPASPASAASAASVDEPAPSPLSAPSAPPPLSVPPTLFPPRVFATSPVASASSAPSAPSAVSAAPAAPTDEPAPSAPSAVSAISAPSAVSAISAPSPLSAPPTFFAPRHAAPPAGPVGGSARSAESAYDVAPPAPVGPAGPPVLSAAAPAGPAGPAPAVPAGPPAPVVSPVSASSVPSADDDVFSVPSASPVSAASADEPAPSAFSPAASADEPAPSPLSAPSASSPAASADEPAPVAALLGPSPRHAALPAAPSTASPEPVSAPIGPLPRHRHAAPPAEPEEEPAPSAPSAAAFAASADDDPTPVSGIIVPTDIPSPVEDSASTPQIMVDVDHPLDEPSSPAGTGDDGPGKAAAGGSADDEPQLVDADRVPRAGDHDGWTVAELPDELVNELGQTLAGSEPGSARSDRPVIDAPRKSPTAPRTALSAICPEGHANPTNYVKCRECGRALAQPARVIICPPLGRVRVSTGEVVELDRPVLVGRAPVPSEVRGLEDSAPAVLTVPSPEQLVSRNHLLIELDEWSVLARNLSESNGTLLLREGEPARKIPSSEPVLLRAGDVLDLGDGQSLTMEDLP